MDKKSILNNLFKSKKIYYKLSILGGNIIYLYSNLFIVSVSLTDKIYLLSYTELSKFLDILLSKKAIFILD